VAIIAFLKAVISPSIVANPMPLSCITNPKLTTVELEDVKMLCTVGVIVGRRAEGSGVGAPNVYVGTSVGEAVGCLLGAELGIGVGEPTV